MFLDTPTTNHELTHQEMACMKTALALVVIKRRLHEQEAASNSMQQQGDSHHPATKKPRRRTSSHSNRRQHWAQHLQHMMGLALDEASSSNTTSGISARFESLVTHMACQINEWATVGQNTVQEGQDEDLQDHQQAPCHTWLQEQLECLLDTTTSSSNSNGSTASSTVVCLVWHHILQVPSTRDVLIPMVLPLLLNATVGVETVRNNNNSSPHGWSLLYALLPLAPLEWVHETLADLLQSPSNNQWTIADLAPTYYHSWQQNKHASWMRWARADLVHRLVARLQDEEEQEQHHLQAQSYY